MQEKVNSCRSKVVKKENNRIQSTPGGLPLTGTGLWEEVKSNLLRGKYGVKNDTSKMTSVADSGFGMIFSVLLTHFCDLQIF